MQRFKQTLQCYKELQDIKGRLNIIRIAATEYLHGSIISYCSFQIRKPTRTASQNL
jgi:hypothetical protein